MFFCCLQMRKVFVFLGVLLTLTSLSCRSTVTSDINNANRFFKYVSTETKFDLGDSNKFEFEIKGSETDGKGRLLIHYEKKRHTDNAKLGTFIKLSENGGETFGKEYEFATKLKPEKGFSSYGFYFVGKGIAVTAVKDRNLYYSYSKESLENWSNPVQINDENHSLEGNIKLLSPNENVVYCVWIDKRRGVNLLFFSVSLDGGKTWKANHPIDFDFRKGAQGFPQIVYGENGRLLVFWEDRRDRNTLVDIRYSYSDDQGETWIASQKINDDTEEVWQIRPTVVSQGSNIYIAFADFRDKGEAGDNDWNIYFTSSTDNGTTWNKNDRINDIKIGRDHSPHFSIDDLGNLYCLWHSTRETLFGQVIFSYSKDQGKTWSPSIALTPENEMVRSETVFIQNLLQDKYLIHWGKENYNQGNSVFSWLTRSSEPLINGGLENKEEIVSPLKYRVGDTLFSDDFSGQTAAKWEVSEGFWDVVNGNYVGVHTSNSLPYASFARFDEPDKYIMQGRFKYDPVSHFAANLYFRTDKAGFRRYVISNHFRKGVWLSIKDDEKPHTPHPSGGIPLKQKRLPFRQDRWYKFTLVVTPEQVDYYVEGKLMLSYKGKLTLPKGKIGIGGITYSPTSFDDISISELK